MSDRVALRAALVLAVLAPNDDAVRRAVEIADQLAARMDPDDIEWAKDEADRWLTEVDLVTRSPGTQPAPPAG